MMMGVNHSGSETAIPICPLCACSEGAFFFQDTRTYFRCPECWLVFVSPEQFLSLSDEKAVYDCHENSPDDLHYRGFLNRLFLPMSERIPANSFGLDFGSGPGPTLSIMFEEAGHTVHLYDKFYAPDTQPLTQVYDFITASEVVEHLQNPAVELETLWSRLKPAGLLGIMTKRVIDSAAFSTWHYKNDPTHVSFFSVATFEWLARHWQATLTLAGQDVVLFQKPG